VDITIRVEWDMGHRLPNHGGLCRNLHGHRYAAEVTLSGGIKDTPNAPDEGMVVDFGPVKTLCRKLLTKRDHQFLLCEGDPLVGVMATLPGVVVVPWIPTAENIALDMLLRLREQVALAETRLVAAQQRDIVVSRLRLYETPTSWAEAS